MITKPVNIGMLYPILQRNKQCLKIELLNSGSENTKLIFDFTTNRDLN